jgi:hypothetical protein
MRGSASAPAAVGQDTRLLVGQVFRWVDFFSFQGHLAPGSVTVRLLLGFPDNIGHSILQNNQTISYW